MQLTTHKIQSKKYSAACMEAMINLTAVWNVTSCVVVQIYQNVGGKTTSVFMVEKYSTQNGVRAIYSSESVANCYHTTRCHTPHHFAVLKYQELN
jgi:hypothetical protein